MASFALGATFFSQPATAQDPEGGDMMGMQMPGPTKHHKFLAKSAGAWDAVLKFRMSPDQPWMESKGSEVNTMTCNGMWLVGKFNGDFMGTPFEGRSVNGYDPSSKEFTGVWVDSMSPSITTMKGEASKDGKTLTQMMTSKDPMSGGEMVQKTVMTFVDNNTRTFEFHQQMGEEWMKTMEIHYTRRK